MMRWLLPIALFAALPVAAQDAGPEASTQSWYCARTSQTAFGSVTVFRYVSLAGEPLGGGTSWMLDTPPQAIGVFGGWSAEFDRETGDDSILISYEALPAHGRYRIEVRREGARGATLARSPLTAPEKGRITFFTDVRLMADAGHGDARLVLLVTDRRGRIVRRDRFDSATFRRFLPVLHDLQAPVEAMAADYRNRCDLIRSDVSAREPVPVP